VSSLPNSGVKDDEQRVQEHIHRGRGKVGICVGEKQLAFIYPYFWQGKSLEELVDIAVKRAFRTAPTD
jgi:hypothetical protein